MAESCHRLASTNYPLSSGEAPLQSEVAGVLEARYIGGAEPPCLSSESCLIATWFGSRMQWLVTQAFFEFCMIVKTCLHAASEESDGIICGTYSQVMLFSDSKARY